MVHLIMGTWLRDSPKNLWMAFYNFCGKAETALHLDFTWQMLLVSMGDVLTWSNTATALRGTDV